LVSLEQAFFDPGCALQPADAIEPLTAYLERAIARGVTPWSVIRHTLGLFHGLPGARAWRRQLSDPTFVARYGAQALRQAAPGPRVSGIG